MPDLALPLLGLLAGLVAGFLLSRWRHGRPLVVMAQKLLAAEHALRTALGLPPGTSRKDDSMTLDALSQQVDATVAAINQAVPLIGQLAAMKDDPIKLQAMNDKLKAAADGLSAASAAAVAPPTPPAQ